MIERGIIEIVPEPPSASVDSTNAKVSAVLFNPPYYSNKYPNLGLRSVWSSLRHRGFVSTEVDLNIQYYRFLVENLVIAGEPLANLETKDRFLRLFFEHNKLGILPERYFSPLHFPQKEDLFDLNDASDVFRFARNRETNPFHTFYDQAVEDCRDALNESGIVGISIISLHQVVPAFTLMASLKERFPDLKIVLWGSWCSTMFDRLLRNKEMPKFADFIIVNEGETAAARLLEKLSSGNDDYSDVPNLVYVENGEYRFSGITHQEDLRKMRRLEYGNLDQYPVHSDGITKTLVFETRRGCYWDKCSFCMHRDGIRWLKTEKSIDTLIEELRIGVESGANNILFSDSAISPRRFRELSEAILLAWLKFEWWCFIRAEKGFDEELLSLWYAAGCREVNVGIESVNERIGKLMNKGVRKENISHLLKSANRAGIETIVDMLVGFPTETMEECAENMEFLESHLPYITEIGANVFSLWKGTEMAMNPEKYGIFISEDPNSFNPEIDFRVDKESFPDAMSKNEILFMAGKMNLLNGKANRAMEKPVQTRSSEYRILELTYDWSQVTPYGHRSDFTIAEFPDGRISLLGDAA